MRSTRFDMILSLLLLVICNLVISNGQSLPQLNFHFVSPDYPGRTPERFDVHLDEELDHLLYGLMCQYEGNRFTVRISPVDGVTKVIDDSMGLTNKTPGAQRCTMSKTPQQVNCVNTGFCTLGNICAATIRAPCVGKKALTRRAMTKYVDVTLDKEDGKILVVKCFTMCVTPQTEEPMSRSKTGDLSYLAVSFIVAGVMLAAILFVALIIVYKIRDSHTVRKVGKRASVVIELVNEANGPST